MEPIFDAQAEGGVIASLLWKPELIMESDFLKGAHFYDVSMGFIYDTIKGLFYQGNSVDPYNILWSMKKEAQDIVVKKYHIDISELKELGRDIARKNPLDYEKLARSVHGDAYRRALSDRIQRLPIEDKRVDVSTLDSQFYEIAEQLSREFFIDDDISLFGDKVQDLLVSLAEDREDRKDGKISWFIPELEKFCHLKAGEMYMVEAKKKVGKSILLMNQAIHLLKRGEPVIYYDSEMNDKLFFLRMAACISGIDSKKIEDGTYSDEEEKVFKRAVDWIEQAPLWHIYIPEFDKASIFRTCRTFKDTKKIRCIIVDYIKSDGSSAEENYNTLGKMTNFWKNIIAGKLDMIVISAAQLNRNGDIADSDKIERYVSFAMKLQGKTSDEISRYGAECGNMKLIIHLNRLGESHDISDDDDYIDLKLSGRIQRLTQATQHVVADNPFK